MTSCYTVQAQQLRVDWRDACQLVAQLAPTLQMVDTDLAAFARYLSAAGNTMDYDGT